MLVLVYAKRTLGCSHVHRQSSTEVDPDITLGEYLSRCHTSALTRYRPFLLSLVLVWQLNYAEIANKSDSLKSYIGSSICNEYVKRGGVSAVLTRFSIVMTVGLSVLAALLTRTVLIAKLF